MQTQRQIKGEKLPKYGYNELRVWPNGTLEFRDKTDVLVRIPHAVIEVKEPHGDLIDKSRAYDETLIYAEPVKSLASRILDCAPTVIEAEGEQ